MMVEIPVVSMTDGGSVERVRMFLDTSSDAPTEEIQGIEDDGQIREQLTLARSAARAFLASPYVRVVSRDTLERGALVARFEGCGPVDGTALGLSFVTGCLALGLDVSLRGDRVFCSGLSRAVGKRGMPGGGLALEPVKGPVRESAVATVRHGTRVFLHADDDDGASRDDHGYVMAGGRRACLLPACISTAVLASMSLHTWVLLRRAAMVDDGGAFCLLLLWSCGEVQDGDSFPIGVGTALALLVARDRLRIGPSTTEFIFDSLPDPYAKRRKCVDDAFREEAHVSSEAMIRRELVKAGISRNPRPLLAPRGPVRPEVSPPSKDDVRQWLADEVPGTLQRLWMALNVVDICHRPGENRRAFWDPGRWGPAILASVAGVTALLGLLAWHGLAVLTGWQLGWALWVIGGLVGVMTYRTAGGPDTASGAVAAACSVVAIVFGSYLAASYAEDILLREQADQLYTRMADMAPSVCAAETEEEKREIIAWLNCEYDSDEPVLSAVSEEQVKSFDERIGPRYRMLLEGDLTRKGFVSQFVSTVPRDRMGTWMESLGGPTVEWVLIGGFLAFGIASGFKGVLR